MAIDYAVDYPCAPKEQLTTQGIMNRLKGAERAQTIIHLFRKNGDDRPPNQMGFEFVRRTPEGVEETRLVLVQDLLDEAAELEPLAHHCQDCPANHAKRRFGCIAFIQYPISTAAESWLLDQLPVPDEPLVWMLLQRGVEEFKYDGSNIALLRAVENVYFENPDCTSRRLGAFSIDANQLFEMVFSVGHITPNHAALLLMFLRAINRDLDAQAIMNIAPAPPDADETYPFLLPSDDQDDRTISEIKHFLRALYTAWTLNVRTLLDV